MKICNFCARSDILCQACNKKLERGEITEMDVKLSRMLMQSGVDFLDSVETEDTITLIVEKEHVKKAIGKMGRNVKKLEEIMNKRIKILEKTEDERKIIEDLLRVPVIGVNILYTSDDDEEKLRIRIEKTYQRRVRESSKETLKKLLGKTLDIVYE
jgi:transcription antitermination factor NusA-like protein